MKKLPDGCVQQNGIDFIYNKFDELGIPLSEIESKKYIKKIDKGLIKYIKERFEAMLFDVRYEKLNSIR